MGKRESERSGDTDREGTSIGTKALDREEALTGEAALTLLRGVTEPLLQWYSTNRRQLPWREEPSPYRVWVSEIMLQQTRVEAGKAYFERFMKTLPEVWDLANVQDEQLMKLWEGLGYYNRARNLKKAAGVVVERYGGEIPASYQELLSLPGVGSYTAGAIASIAFGIPVPAVDGNVLRVLSRMLQRWEDISKASVKKGMEEMLLDVIPKDRPGDFNQALMEVGALVCLPNGAPKCGQCPAGDLCLARRCGTTGEIPVKKVKKERRIEKKTVLLLLDDKGRMALRQRPPEGLLSGLWELPSLDGTPAPEQIKRELEQAGIVCGELREAGAARHVFSHVEWHMTGYTARVSSVLKVAETPAAYRAPQQPHQAHQPRQPRQKKEDFRLVDLVFVSGKDLREGYALPSAFRGFQAYFPK